MALAPSLDLVGVPSNANIFLSMARCSSAEQPISAGAMIVFTLATAFKVPFPL